MMCDAEYRLVPRKSEYQVKVFDEPKILVAFMKMWVTNLDDWICIKSDDAGDRLVHMWATNGDMEAFAKLLEEV